ncbi:MAG: gltK [Proteobacteria bacterium]|nr:gltK [Pseudomonadota bacterium]
MYDFDFDVIQRSLPYLWKGLQYTATLTLVAMVGGIVIGTLLAMARLSSIKILYWPASIYVNLLRSTPLILVIFWFYFLVPLIAQWITNSPTPVSIGADRSAFITFTIFEAAYYCEIIRAGIQSIPRGQVAAGYALGLTYGQSMRHVMVYVLSVTDLLGAASKVAQRDSRLVEMYSFAAVCYFAVSYTLSLTVKRLQKRFAQ